MRERTDLIQHMLSRPFLKGRIGKWVFALSEFSFNYLPQQSVKGQVLAEFLINHPFFLGKQLPDQDDGGHASDHNSMANVFRWLQYARWRGSRYCFFSLLMV